MEEVRREKIFPGVELMYVHMEKFKTCLMSVTFVRRLDRGEAALNSLLPAVLLRGTENYPDLQSFSARLDDLYGAEIELSVRKKGERQLFGFFADFVDEKYVGEPLTEQVAELLGELTLRPARGDGGGLRDDYFESEKKNLLDEIASQINDKRSYSLSRLINLMFEGEPYGVNKLGERETAGAVTRRELEAHYDKALASFPMVIYFCGSTPYERVREAVVRGFGGLKRESAGGIDRGTIFKKCGSVRDISEHMDVAQGKLAIGFRFDSEADFDLPSALMLNAIFGGMTTSKLFMNLREKLSLCYFASSMLDRWKKVMLVSSGIDFDKFESAKSEIFRQLEDCRIGNISEREMENARLAIATAIRTTEDSQGRLEDYCMAHLVNAEGGYIESPEALLEKVDKVTVESVMAAAAALCADTVYFLRD